MERFKLIFDISRAVLSSEFHLGRMAEILASVGTYLDISRAFVCLDSVSGDTVSCAAEWNGRDTPVQANLFQLTPYSSLPSLRPLLERDGLIVSSNISELPSDLRTILEAQTVQAIVIHPLIIRRELRGFICFDECRRTREWRSLELDQLNSVALMVSLAYERRDGEDALEKFAALFRENPALMAVCEVPGLRFIEVNDAFCRRLGYDRNDVVGRTVFELELFPPTGTISDIIDRIEKTETLPEVKGKVKRKDGSTLFGLISGRIVQSGGKKVFLSVMVDISAQVSLTERVEFERRRLENIIEGTQVGTWEWNIRTGELIVNKRWSEMLGYATGELEIDGIGSLLRFVHRDDLPNPNERLMRHFEGKSDLYEGEYRVRRRDGGWIWVQDRGAVIEWDKAGFPIRMFGTRTDITDRKRAEAVLLETERRFELALAGTGAGLWDWDMLNSTIFYSSQWKKMLGFEEAEIGDTVEEWKSRWHPEDAPSIERAMSEYLAGKTPNYEITHRLRHKDGSWRWILSRGAALRTKDGMPYRWIGTHIDVTEEKERSEELERFFSVNLDLLCIADVDGSFIKLNRAWEDILGYSVSELKSRKFLDFVHPDDVANTVATMARLGTSEKVLNFVNRYRHKDGSYRYIEWRSHPYGRLIYAAARDITDRIESENRLRELSIRDSLTGAYNRRYVFDRLEALIAEFRRTGKEFSVAIVDLDHFKNVNDTYGHQAGDAVLRAFSHAIAKDLRPYDLLGRYGGEEFIIVFLDIRKGSAHAILERILERFRELTIEHEAARIRCTFSGGVGDSSEVDAATMCAESLIERADRRLYQAKQSGRDRVVEGDNVSSPGS